MSSKKGNRFSSRPVIALRGDPADSARLLGQATVARGPHRPIGLTGVQSRYRVVASTSSRRPKPKAASKPEKRGLLWKASGIIVSAAMGSSAPAPNACSRGGHA